MLCLVGEMDLLPFGVGHLFRSLFSFCSFCRKLVLFRSVGGTPGGRGFGLQTFTFCGGVYFGRQRLLRSFRLLRFIGVLFVPNGQFSQVVHRTVVDVHVDLAVDAVDHTHISVLPEFPLAAVADLFHIVVSNPKGITVKLRCAEIALFELQSGVDNRERTEASFHEVEPFESFFSQGFRGEVAKFLNVQYGGEVAFFELHVVHEIARLSVARDIGGEIMVGAADEAIFSRFAKVAQKFSIQMAFPFGGLDEDKFHAGFPPNGGGRNLFPVDGALVVAHIKSVNGVIGRQFGVAEDGSPAIAVRNDEKVIEE